MMGNLGMNISGLFNETKSNDIYQSIKTTDVDLCSRQLGQYLYMLSKIPTPVGHIYRVKTQRILVKSSASVSLLQPYLISVTGGRDTGLKPRIADLVPGSWAQVSLNYILHQVKN
jgi:hypothetical protein